jgi:hypothetical protein
VCLFQDYENIAAINDIIDPLWHPRIAENTQFQPR